MTVRLKNLPISSLKLAKFNPKGRQADIKTLTDSIERMGLLSPITVTLKNEVADGHRRVAACKKLGWTEIPCWPRKGTLAELFQEINGQFKSLTGNQTLQVYLSEPNAIGFRVRNLVAECEAVCGRALVKKMAENNYTIATYKCAKHIAKAADIDDDLMLKNILKWVMKYRCTRTVRLALYQGMPASKLIAAVNHDKPIRVKYGE